MPHQFTNNLKLHLSKEIKGKVYVHTYNDILIVDIYGANGVNFKYTRYDIFSEIVHGLSSERLSQEIVKRYTHYILNLYFL